MNRLRTPGLPHPDHTDSDPKIAGQERESSLLAAALLSIMVYGIFSLLYLLISDLMDGEPVLFVIHTGSALALLVFWKSLVWGKGRFDSFGAALLLIYAIFKLQGAVDAWFYGARIEQIYHTVPLPESLIWLFLKAESLNFLGVLLLVGTWRLAVGKQVGAMSFLGNRFFLSSRIPALVYAIALSLEFLRRILGLDFGFLSQILGLTYSFGVVAIYFIASQVRGAFRQVCFALLLAIPLVFFNLGTGMKEKMIFPIIPALIIAWFSYRSTLLRISVIAAAVIVLAYSQLYVKYVRAVAWGNSDYSTAQLIQGFGDHLQQVSLKEGLDSISSRLNMTLSRAITVAIADARGFEPYQIFAPIPASLVPRAVWADKPVLMPGAQHTLRIHNLNLHPREAWSATASGFFSELYLGGGYIGWLMGLVIYGLMLGWSQLFVLKHLSSVWTPIYCFLIYYWVIRFEENHVVYTYTALVFTFVLVVMLARFTATLVDGLGKQNSPIRSHWSGNS